jgi:hypothetical protein
MCAALGIKIIPASSPQAKGRIERNHGTHQDRLVKKLRRHAIADIAGANAFLEAEYWSDHNRRFAQAASAADDFHVAVPRTVRLDAVFRLEAKRSVSNDWVVRYDNRVLQLERQSDHPPARGTVLVYEAIDGTIEIRYRDRVMRWTEHIAATPSVARSPAPAPVDTAARPVHNRPNVSADHPWYHASADHHVFRQRAKDRRAWERVQP